MTLCDAYLNQKLCPRNIIEETTQVDKFQRERTTSHTSSYIPKDCLSTTLIGLNLIYTVGNSTETGINDKHYNESQQKYRHGRVSNELLCGGGGALDRLTGTHDQNVCQLAMLQVG